MADKVVCITGGYGRLGRDLARAFREEGDAVVITGRDPEKLQAAAGELGVAAFSHDVSNFEQTAALRDFLDEKHGRLDVLINNAACFRPGYVDELQPEQFLESLITNLYGPFLGVHVLLPLIMKSEAGLIINVSSTSGHRADPGASAYNSSKFGLMGFTEALRQELREHGIRVSTLSPSGIYFGESEERGKGVHLNGRDVAAAAVFLATHPARTLIQDIEMWTTNP